MVARIQGGDLDLARNSLLNAVIQVLSTDPTPATAGRIYYNSTSGSLMVGNGTSFVQIAAGAGYGDEQAQDAVAAMLSASAQAQITGTYDDANNKYTLTITPGSITDSMVSSTAAISADKTADGTTNKAFTATERTKLAGIATGATAYNDEAAQDAVAALLAAGSQTGITVTYNDAANSMTLTITGGSIVDSMISSSAAISQDKTADGTTYKRYSATEQTKLAGIATGATNYTDTNARANRLDQFAAPTATVNFNSQRITAIADAIANTDVPSYGQILGLLQGRNDKTVVRTIAVDSSGNPVNVVLASAAANGATIGNVTVATGDRVAFPGQTTGSENGIYVINASGAPTRAADFDTGAEAKDAFFFVSEGYGADTGWKVMNDGTITLGTTALVISKITDATTISVTAGGGLTKTGTVLNVDSTVVAKKAAIFTIGDGTATSFTLNHNLNNQGAQVRVYYAASTFDEIDVVVRHTDANNLTVLFNTAPTSGQFKASVIG